jgi:tetratricopeptide (TPR) repeat protein
LNKYPTDIFLLEMSAINYSFLGEDKDALEVLNTGLKLYPNNVRLLYIRANKLEMDGSAWDEFLALAPKDHPKVPTAFYRKAYCGNPNNPNPHKLVECYEKGVAAERDQLPCFLPYDFPPKYRLEKLCSAVKSKMPSSKAIRRK